MRSLSYSDANKVAATYLTLFESPEYKYLLVKDVTVSPSSKGDSKAIIKVITGDNHIEDLDNFCLRNDVEYSLSA